jgi:nicotinate phosphoribosyltransferase
MINNMEFSALYTDLYELTMSQGYFFSDKKNDSACFDYFFRKNPFKGGYTVFAGLSDFLSLIKDFTFTDDNLRYLSSIGFNRKFVEYLKDFKFKGKIYSFREGEIIFPDEPIIRIEGNIIECQLIETLLLNIINFESLIATKTCRIVYASKGKPVIDFGLRRAQGFGGLQASKAAIIGGANGTSNTLAGYLYNMPVKGTHAHSWVQSFDSEIEAFRRFVENWPENSILLIDTYDTLNSGLPNAIKVAKEMEKKGKRLLGLRLDSGDFAYLSKKVRSILDSEGLDYVKIVVSNQLDEYTIQSLNNQQAPVDLFGVGTKLITAYDQPALDGVFKLAAIKNTPKIKISDNIEKVTIPGVKKVKRFYDNNKFLIDGISLINEEKIKILRHSFIPYKKANISKFKSEELMSLVFDNGEILNNHISINEIAKYRKKRFDQLPDEHKRFVNPHCYRVGLSKKLWDLKDKLIKQYKK